MYRFNTLVALAGAGLVAATATAQLAPPPPPPVEKEPVTYPPPPPPPRPQVQQQPRQRGAVAPPNFEFKKLAEFDAQGNLKPMLQSPEYLAVVRNPKIEAEQVPELREAMDSHFEKVDNLVIENIDLVMDVAGGIFDEADLNDPEDFNTIQGMMPVLMTARGLADHLEREEALNAQQKSATQAIFADWVQTYNKHALDEAMEEHGEDRKKVAEEMGRAMFHMLSIEAMVAYRRMALQVADNFDAVVEAAELDDAEGVDKAGAALAAADGDEARYQVVVDFMADLGFREQQALLEANRAMAPKRTYPELEKIGKVD